MGGSEGSVGSLDAGGGEDPKISSRVFSVVAAWSLSLCMAAVVLECVEVTVVEGERGAEGVDSGESICVFGSFPVCLCSFFGVLLLFSPCRCLVVWEAKKDSDIVGFFLNSDITTDTALWIGPMYG